MNALSFHGFFMFTKNIVRSCEQKVNIVDTFRILLWFSLISSNAVFIICINSRDKLISARRISIFSISRNRYINTLTATRGFKEISVRPRVQQYQEFSARRSHRYFSNASRSSGGLNNDLSFRSFATLKPLAVVEYNEGKCGIDYSDQMVSYATTIRKGIKWYRKLGIQLLLGISVVNALTVYKIATRKNIDVRIFRQLLVAKLLGLSENTKNPCLRRSWHNIAIRKDDSGRSIRRACKLSYANKRRRMDRTKAQKNLKKTIAYCPNCPD